MKTIMLDTYACLLADVSKLSGFSEIRGSRCDLQWCVIDAPKLEKQLLVAVETGSSEEFIRNVPASLKRLALGALVDPIQMRYLRQLLLFCYKAYAPHDSKTTTEAFQGFIRVNEEVRQVGNSFAGACPILLDLARQQVQSVLYRFNPKRVIPFHGPGASTTPKERWTRWFDSIEYLYPYSDYYACFFNQAHCAEIGDETTSECITAKLIAVPKDSRGPRLICVHPAEAIWLQQGLRTELERAIGATRMCRGPWPKNHVNFDNQDTNGRIALASSKSLRYATLDMKEASDRISDVLVQYLFGEKYKYFGCCRAQKYTIPNWKSSYDDNIHSYAPMGNATTFPVESLVFWAICVASLQYHGFHQPGAVFVFGDDIVVPSSLAPRVIEDLESFGLIVNRTKSFWRGHFRESCGVDAFNGVVVTPVRWRCSYDPNTDLEVLALCDMAMRLRINHYHEASCIVYQAVRTYMRNRHAKDLFLTNNPEHGGVAEFTELSSQVWRDAYWHRDYQRYVSPVWSFQDCNPKGMLRGWNLVLESLTSLERFGRSNVPDRSVSRRMRLVRGMSTIL